MDISAILSKQHQDHLQREKAQNNDLIYAPPPHTHTQKQIIHKMEIHFNQ